MTQLVFIENGRTVTDSLTVAEVFGKNHKDVLRDIRDLECSKDFRERNFAPSSYCSEQRKELPKYIISQDGFSFLVMGYTGKEAARFKETYIDEFNRMRDSLTKPPVLNERQALLQSLKLTIELSEEVATQGEKLQELEHKVDEQITLDHGEQRRLQRAVATRVNELESDRDNQRPMYSGLYREIKDRWGVGSYVDVKRKDLQDVIRYVEAWRPKIK